METVLVTMPPMLLPQDSMMPEVRAICAAGDVLGLCSLRGLPDVTWLLSAVSELVVLTPQSRAVLIFVVLVTTKGDADVLPPEVMLTSMDAEEPTLVPLTGELYVCPQLHPITVGAGHAPAGELAPPLASQSLSVQRRIGLTPFGPHHDDDTGRGMYHTQPPH